MWIVLVVLLALLCGGARAEEAGQAVLSLFGPEADLAGLAVSVPGLERQKEGQWLPLLEILWETGRLERTDLEFT